MVGCFYFIIDHVILILSISLDHQCYSKDYINLQHLIHNHISISHTSILSSNQYNYFRLNNFKIYSMANKFEKIIA
jgi:sensor domain CHASE-containing protein